MGKIAGNTVGVPNPRPDWNQNDSTKADYIKNKPSILTEEDVVGLIAEMGGASLSSSITGEGAPTDATEGAVGCLYMDITNGDLYKCTNVGRTIMGDSIYTWCKIGGGESITVDQTYNPESENAQSGKAVAEAIESIKKGGDYVETSYTNPNTSVAAVGYEWGFYVGKNYEELKVNFGFEEMNVPFTLKRYVKTDDNSLTLISTSQYTTGETITLQSITPNDFITITSASHFYYTYEKTFDAILGYNKSGVLTKPPGGYLSGTFIVKELKEVSSKSDIEGLNVTVIGDSITEHNYRANTNWAMWLSQWSSCNVQNLGLSGTGFSPVYGTNQPYIERISQINSDVDIIGVACSFNDIVDGNTSKISLGDVADTGTTSIYGYANDFFETLIEAFPNTPIICYIQNTWHNRRIGVEISDNYINGIKQICNSKGIPFYGDMYFNGSVLKPWLESNCEMYFKSDVNNVVDNVHPNSLGHKVIAKYLLPIFEQNVVNKN